MTHIPSKPTDVLKRLVPSFLKPALRQLYGAARFRYGKLTHRPSSRDALHQYWRHPADAGNSPTAYLDGRARSLLLVDLVSRHIGPVGHRARILEVGCNIGRNLNSLHSVGYADLTAIEISSDALRLLAQHFPELSRTADLRNSSVEETIRTFPDGAFDLIYTMAVLEHIHTESEWVFAEIARATRHLLITIEDEHGFSVRHFPRRYDKVFPRFGLTQIAWRPCTEVDGFGGGFVARVFSKTCDAA